MKLKCVRAEHYVEHHNGIHPDNIGWKPDPDLVEGWIYSCFVAGTEMMVYVSDEKGWLPKSWQCFAPVDAEECNPDDRAVIAELLKDLNEIGRPDYVINNDAGEMNSILVSLMSRARDAVNWALDKGYEIAKDTQTISVNDILL